MKLHKNPLAPQSLLLCHFCCGNWSSTPLQKASPVSLKLDKGCNYLPSLLVFFFCFFFDHLSLPPSAACLSHSVKNSPTAEAALTASNIVVGAEIMNRLI